MLAPHSSAAHERLSLETLYRDYADFVWRMVCRFGIPEAMAEDVVHEVFLIVRRKLPEFEGRSTPQTWLYGIARGVCSNVRRSRERARARLVAVPAPGASVEPDEVVRRQQAAALVEVFLAQLKPEQREVFELMDIEGMSAPEVAESLGVGVNVVYSRLRLARRHFTRFLERMP